MCEVNAGNYVFFFRYYNILNKISQKESSLAMENDEQSVELIIDRIRDVSAIQTVNAIFQYCPQFFFQSVLLIYVRYTCLLTGKYSEKYARNSLSLLCIFFFHICRSFRWVGLLLLCLAHMHSFLLSDEAHQGRLQAE